MSKKVRVNREIRAPKVRLIDQDGGQVGIVDLREALLKAEEAGLDLVEVSAGAEVPVVKLLDFGKFKYEQDKKIQKAKKAQKAQEIKGIRLSVKIGEHDFETKAKKAKEFLEKGHKVALQLRFKGREMAHKELGEKVLREFASALGEDIAVDQEPKLVGRGMTMVVGKKKKG